ncbi:MAG: hypothetical protein WC028_05820 [Candidatus Obscuribacterales bacterium]|jgi:hypothetical protein
MLSLKPLDIAVLLKIIATESPGIATVGAQELALKQWTPSSLAVSMYLNPSDVYAALQRAGKARLFDSNRKVVKIPALEEFVFHGLQYVFLANEGALTRGMPTSLAAPPLVLTHFDEPDTPPIWPHLMGTKRGYSIEPLYKRAADAAAADNNFYELLALVDAVREGGPRVKSVAVLELKKRFKAYSDKVSGN